MWRVSLIRALVPDNGIFWRYLGHCGDFEGTTDNWIFWRYAGQWGYSKGTKDYRNILKVQKTVGYSEGTTDNWDFVTVWRLVVIFWTNNGNVLKVRKTLGKFWTNNWGYSEGTKDNRDILKAISERLLVKGTTTDAAARKCLNLLTGVFQEGDACLQLVSYWTG